MGNNIKVILVLLSNYFSLDVSAQSANQTYFGCLQTYWNYRYHLLGDYTLHNQYMPWQDNFQHSLGEPGMLLRGTVTGHAIPADGIGLFKIKAEK